MPPSSSPANAPEVHHVPDSVEALTPHLEDYGTLTQNKNFIALWVGQVFSQLADRIILVVFVAMIVNHFGTNPNFKTNLYVAFTIPAILLTAVAGVFVDRWPRRNVLVATNVLRALFVSCMPLVTHASLWAVYGLAFMISVATQFFVPAEAATIPMIVKKQDLIAANSLFTTTMMASVIFGFALGDPLINIFRLSQVHWAIVGLFVLSSVSLMFIKTPPPAVSQGEKKTQTLSEAVNQFFVELKDGISYIRENPVILNAILKLATLFCGVVVLCFLFMSFAEEFLYEDAKVAAQKFGYIIAASGLGMALGAVLVGRFAGGFPRRLMVYGGFAATGLWMLCLVLIAVVDRTNRVFTIPSMTLGPVYLDSIQFTFRMLYTYLFSTLMGVGAAFVAIPLQALLHERIPEDKRGKILGVQFTILSTCSTLPAVATGLIIEHVGTCLVLELMGAPLLLVGIWGLLRKRRGDGHAITPDW